MVPESVSPGHLASLVICSYILASVCKRFFTCRSIVSLVQWLQQDNKGLSGLSGKLKHVTTVDESPESNVAELARKLKQLETTAKLYDQKISTDVTKGSK